MKTRHIDPRRHTPGVIPVHVTKDALLYTDKCHVHWLILSAGAQASTVEVRDGHDDDDPVKLTLRAIATHSVVFAFEPAARFVRGLYIDLGTNVAAVCVGAEAGWHPDWLKEMGEE